MPKIGEFIYPWGAGHYSRMMRLNEALAVQSAEAGCDIKENDIHISSKGRIYEQLLERYPDKRDKIHEILMPTPIDGKTGPSITMSLANVLLPVSDNPPLVKQIAHYLRQERRLYDTQKFDLVISDGDMGTNVLAKNRAIPSLFVTNQFRPKLYSTRSYLYPSLLFIAKQITKASKILVADSPPPHTLCEYNLNFTKEAEKKVVYVGHFTNGGHGGSGKKTDMSDLQKIIEQDGGQGFGYWMRTGNKSTNDGTGRRYEEAFRHDMLKNERRIVSHARNDPSIDSVLGVDQKRYTFADALDKKVDWMQIDVGFLSEQEKDAVLNRCTYAVVNGSHTVMGEILGGKAKPVIGIPVYDEHTNNIRWAENKNLGALATKTEQVASAIMRIKEDYGSFEENLSKFSKNFVSNGAQTTAQIVLQALEEKR